ncbi:hypothetical protein [Streptomyces sp. SID3343]|uniref:hypothetical protein n=1 Tax=Streptomyces sp. SID3343 TaxID=2690260 RepID=UPI00136F8A12|nr:hypothetical protein [Streptomyces sp. SID3343]MYV97314.1 hypothetical protein [Streptomyces sp. SID3343]
MIILRPYDTDYRELQFMRSDGRRELSLHTCLNEYFAAHDAVILPGAGRAVVDGEHLRPGARVRVHSFANHGFNGVLAYVTPLGGQRGGHIGLERLAVLPTGAEQLRDLAQLKAPDDVDIRTGRPAIDVAAMRRDDTLFVAITPGVDLRDRFMPSGYTYTEPVPGDQSASHVVVYVREIVARYLPHSPLPIRFRLPWQAAARERRDMLTHARAGALNPAQVRALAAIAAGGVVLRGNRLAINNRPDTRLAVPTYVNLRDQGLVEPSAIALRDGRELRLTSDGWRVHKLLASRTTPPTRAAAASTRTTTAIPAPAAPYTAVPASTTPGDTISPRPQAH